MEGELSRRLAVGESCRAMAGRLGRAPSSVSREVDKVYSRFSSRRFTSDLREANVRGLIGRVPHFNSVTGYLANPELTPILGN